MASLVTVTGASGHIGSHVVKALLAQGRKVRAVYIGDAPALEGLDVERVVADVTDAAAVHKALAGSEVVYHLAAVISLMDRDAELMRRVNVDGVKNVVDACLAHGVKRLVHFSSIHAYQPVPDGQTLDETCALALGENTGLPPYDRSKAHGTQHVHDGIAKGLSAVLLHPVGVIGPGDFMPSQIGNRLLQIANGTLPGLVVGGFSWVDVRDVADAALVAETKGRDGEHYLIGGPWCAVVKLGDFVEELTGVPRPRLVTPLWLARATVPFVEAIYWLLRKDPPYNASALHALYHHQKISYEKAVRELGLKNRPIRDTVIDTIRWFDSRGQVRPPGRLRIGAASTVSGS